MYRGRGLSYRWIPKDATAIEHPQGLGVAYAYMAGTIKQTLAVVAYRGKANKADFHQSFKSQINADVAISQWFDGLTRHQAFVAERRKQQNAPHNFKVGDVVYNSWGYDQTNVDFYEVVRATANFVWLKRLQQSTNQDGFMSGTTVPVVGKYVANLENNPVYAREYGQVEKHKASGEHVTFKFGSGSRWTGKPLYTSWYA